MKLTRGLNAPLLLSILMLNKETLVQLVKDYISKNESIFLVDLIITRSNQIEILIDSFTGISIKNCISLSRHIESSLDREVCDFFSTSCKCRFE